MFPERLPNDWIGLDPRLGPTSGCEPPAPAAPGPAIDAGDPEILDPDGSRSDLGATGGPDALRDRDGDGSFDGEDCDDLDPEQGPGRSESCDGEDDDCDGQIDEGCDGSSPTGPRLAAPLAAEEAGCACASSPPRALCGSSGSRRSSAGGRRRPAGRAPAGRSSAYP